MANHSLLSTPPPAEDVDEGDDIVQFSVFAEGKSIALLERVVQLWQSIAANNAVLRTVVQKRNPPPKDSPHLTLTTIAPVTLDHAWHHERPDSCDPAQLVITLDGSAFNASVRIHRMLIDSTSTAIIRKYFAGLAEPLSPPRQLNFEDATRQRSPEENEASRKLWKEVLAGLATSPFHCFGLKTPERYAEVARRLSSNELSRVKAFANGAGVSLRTMLQSAWAIVTAVHSQASHGSVAFATVGRDLGEPDLAMAIGPFDRKYILAIPVDGATPMREWVRLVQANDRLGSRHAFVGYETILEQTVGFCPASLMHVRAASSDRLDDVSLSRDRSVTRADGSQDQGELPSLQLDCETDADDSSVQMTLRFDSQVAPDEAHTLLNHFATALSNICNSATVADCGVISSTESEQLLRLAEPETEAVAGIVHHLFEHQVELTPNADAVQFETTESLTYAALNQLANGVARQLCCPRGSLIPISMPRSINLIVAILAVVKAGCAYVPLDPSVPEARNQFIFEDVDAPFALVSKSTAGVLPKEIMIEDLVDRAGKYDSSNLSIEQTPEDLVYVVYTSGSTGRPKGVLLEHKAAYTGLHAFPRLEDLRQLLFHNPVFSAAQRSIWSTLKQGGCLCLASKDNLTSTISHTINSMQVNVIDVTPSTASFIAPGTVPSLRRMTVAGELINPALVPLWVNELEFLNAYGLSENTQFNWRQVLSLGQNPQNIGRPCDTTTSYVLIPGTTQLAPMLVPGELCLGGHQLARGYLNRPEKTKEVFIPNPFGIGRLYRTGDLVVTHADGSIEMIGRIDFSVKINDQRVDPGEPNSLIQLYRGVSDSAVVAANISGTTTLVAVVLADIEENPADLKRKLRAHLEKHLPQYMIPVHWLIRSELPLNINGKVDIPLLRKMCEDLGWQGLSERDMSKSCEVEWTVQEQLVRDVLSEVTSIPSDQLSPDDTFLSLGGNSLSAIQATALGATRELRIRTADLLQGLSISELATGLKKNVPTRVRSLGPFSLAPEGLVIDRETAEDAFVATPLQEAILADSMLQKADYMIKKVYKTDGLRHGDLVAAVKAAIHYSSLMRTTFRIHGSLFVQIIQKHMDPPWHQLDMDVADYVQKRATLVVDNAGTLEGPMLRVVILRSYMVLEIHHALFDHWSARFFIQDIRSALKKQALQQRPSFRTFVHYLNNLDKADSLNFWQDRLQGITPSLLEQGSPIPFKAHAELSLGPFSPSSSGSESMASSMIYLAWAMVLSKWTSSPEVTFGVTASGRDAPVADVMNMEGPTISVAPLRVRLDDTQSIATGLDNIKASFWDMSSHSHIGMHRILQQASTSTQLFNTTVNVLVRPPEEDADGLLEPMEELLQTETDMLHIDYFDGERRVLRATSAWSFPQADSMFADLVSLLQIIAQDSQTTIGSAWLKLESVRAPSASSEHTTKVPTMDRPEEGAVAQPTILHPDSGQSIQSYSMLSVPAVSDPDSATQAMASGDLWSAAWAVLLSRHTTTECPLFGRIRKPAKTNEEWRVRPQWLAVRPKANWNDLQLAPAHLTFTQGLADAVSPDSVEDGPFCFSGIPFDTSIHIVDSGIASEAELWVTAGETWSASKRCTLLTVVETPNETTLHLSSFMDHIRANFILESVAMIAQELIHQQGESIGEIDIIGASEMQYHRKLARHRDPDPDLLHRPFERQAHLNPTAIALQLERKLQVTYGDLNSRANRFARYLINAGVKKGQPVALYLQKSAEMLVSILAVLKTGAFYVPLSPENPPERNLLIMDAVDVVWVINSTATPNVPERPRQVKIAVDALDTRSYDEGNFGSAAPDDLAYIIFTSGSTGTPKGVKVSHRAISTAIAGIVEAEGTNSSWRGLFFFNYIFDASLHDIFPILSSGGTLCMASEDRLTSDLAGVINEMDVRQLFLMPTVARLLKPEDVPGLEVFIVGGEHLHPETVKAWTTRKMIQIYGPTESSVIVATKVMSADTNPRNLGRPMKTASAMVLDFDSDRLAPFGSIGELCLAGNQLADGYWQRDDLTTKAFTANPFAEPKGTSKIYRTGDRVRWLSGGELEYLGRIDHQIKLNGFRIELGEIEQTILRTGLVSNCAVAVVEQSGRPQLAAFCIFEPSDEGTFQDPARFSTSLSLMHDSIGSLAHYMLPKLVFPLGRFPTMHASTKTDRKKLIHLAESLSNVELARYNANKRQDGTSSADPNIVLSTEEAFLQQAWSDLFKVPLGSIGANSSFFALGGDSIAAIILVDVCRRSGYGLTVSDVTKEKELGKIAMRLQRKSSATAQYSQAYTMPQELQRQTTSVGLTDNDIDYVYPCPAGQSEWLAQGDRPTQNWVVTASRSFSGDHDVESYTKLLQDLTHKNDILRTTFTHVPMHGWVGVVLRGPIVDFEIRTCDKGDKQRIIDQVAKTRFQFGRPFIRYLLLSYPDGSRDLVIKANHGLWDGTSLRIFDEAILALQQEDAVVSQTPFKDFVFAERSSDKKKSLDFWTEKLAGSSPVWPIASNPIVSRIHRQPVNLKKEVDQFASQCNVTPAIVFQAAFQVWQATMSRQSASAFNYLLTGRNVELPNPQTITGPCANFLPFRLLIKPLESAQDYLERTQNHFWEATEYSNVGLEDIRQASGQEVRNTCLFLFQPFDKTPAPPPSKMRWLVLGISQAQMNQPYALIQEISKPLGGTEYSFDMKYDESVLSLEDVKRAVAYQVAVLQTWISGGGDVTIERTVQQAAAP